VPEYVNENDELCAFFGRSKQERSSSSTVDALVTKLLGNLIFIHVFCLQLSSYKSQAILSQSISPLETIEKFWTPRLSDPAYKSLAEFAINILIVPPSSASIERVFSIASMVQGGKRRAIGQNMTEKELIIRTNSYLIDE
jgi:hypothetical protein